MRTFRINDENKLDMVKLKDTDDYEEKIKDYKNRNYILKFSASWCNPCKKLQQDLENLAPFLRERDIGVIHADVDKCKILAQQFEIGPIPTFFFFKTNSSGSEKVKKFVGIPENLKAELESCYGDCPIKTTVMFERPKSQGNPFFQQTQLNQKVPKRNIFLG